MLAESRRGWISRVAWRYLYGGKRDRSMLSLTGASLLCALIGLVMVLISDGATSVGVVTLVGGLIASVLFTLLTFLSVFTSVSVLGVVFGVAALTTVLSVTTGFQERFREKVLGVNAHVIIMRNDFPLEDYRAVMESALAADPGVVAVQPFIFAEMLVTRGKGQISGVAIKGVDPTRVSKVLDLQKHMVAGSIELLGAERGPGQLPPVIMGKELARKLKANVGDEVTVVVPLSNLDFDTLQARANSPRTQRFAVAGIFYSGFDEYDRRLMYTSLADTQALVGRGDEVMGIELKLRNVDGAATIAAKLRTILPAPDYKVQDWYELNENLFQALRLQKIVLTTILTFIIMVAAFNMVSALTMMVTEKTRDIAILKSMGATSGRIAGLFVVVGVVISSIGTLIGVSLGLAICQVVSRYGYRLDPRVYLIDRLPISIQPREVLLVCGITVGIGILATIIPALKASSLRPIEGLRYD